MMTPLTLLKSIPALLVLLTGASGCAEVAPWERGILAKPHMALTPQPLQSSVRDHSYGSREAGANGASGSGAGGCGCY